MKVAKYIIVLLLICTHAVQQSTAQRYLTSTFEKIDSTAAVSYGSADRHSGETELLSLDFYEPHADKELERPLLIFAHGGGFAMGTRNWPSIQMICKKMAQKGYAVANIDYRLDQSFRIFQSDSNRRAMTDAMHDMRAAIRFFKANHKKYRIDTSKIFITGESAGAAAAMMAGYIDEQDELAVYPGAKPNNIEGNSGTPGYSSDVKAVLCLCGLIFDTAAIKSDDPPLLWIHGSKDPLVPFPMAEQITQRAEHVGLTHEKIVFEDATHCPWYYGLPDWQKYLDSTVTYMSHFMFPLVTGKKAPVVKKANVPSFKVANILQKNMVVQQGKPFRLWGTADPEKELVLTADWTTKKQRVKADENGRWEGSIRVPAAKKGNYDPHHITIVCDDDTIKLDNLLIGDVWLCAGQSNMDMGVGKMEGWYPGVLNWEQELAAADFPAIRLFKMHAAFKVTPQQDTRGTWTICSPETVRNFSAVSYFFGTEVFRKMDIPIGLVVTAAAGASGQAFTPPEILTGDPAFKKYYVDPVADQIATQQQVDSLGFFTLVTKPSLIYNGMIHPLEKLSLRGFLWYQGESNYTEKGRYTTLINAMLKSWRDKFDQGDLPFYFAQIAPHHSAGDTTGNMLGYLWEAQKAILNNKHSGWAVTTDVGEKDNIHPSDKKTVGLRLARSALHQTYGLKDVVYRGPRYASIKVDQDTVIVNYKATGLSGKLETRDGKPPAHFLVAGRDQKFYPAIARIENNRIKLNAPQVKEPVAVRYAFENWIHTNLQNTAGLPAEPFRTDKWDN